MASPAIAPRGRSLVRRPTTDSAGSVGFARPDNKCGVLLKDDVCVLPCGGEHGTPKAGRLERSASMICPTGLFFELCVKASPQIYSAFPNTQISYITASSRPT